MTGRVRKVPERMCVGCGELRPKKELIRVVRSPEGEVSIDPTGKQNGRGAYIDPRPECLEKALKSRRLERNLAVPLPPEVVERLRAQLTPSAF